MGHKGARHNGDAARVLTRKLNADITINQGSILIIGYSLREVSNYIAQLTQDGIGR